MNEQWLAAAGEYAKGKKRLALEIGIYEQGRIGCYAYHNGVLHSSEGTGDAFEIGSLTKLFTAALLADAALEGRLTLDAAVGQLLPEEGRSNPYLHQATLVHLATHTSGLPRLASNMRPKHRLNPYADYGLRELLAWLVTYSGEERIGEYEYSNTGYGLLGELIEMRCGEPYAELLRSRLLLPLGMTETGIEPGSGAAARLRQGHASTGRPVPHWTMGIHAGAGGLKSTVLDLLKFVEAGVDERHPMHPVIKECLRPHPIGERTHRLGWHALSDDGTEWLWHNGATYGCSSFAAIQPERRIGVVLLSNYGPHSPFLRDALRRLLFRTDARRLSLDGLAGQLIRGFNDRRR